MGAIVLDASKINSYVIPSLNKSKNTMQDAYSTGQSLRNSLPSSFKYRSTVSDIVNQLYNLYINMENGHHTEKTALNKSISPGDKTEYNTNP